MSIKNIINKQKKFYNKGKTNSYEFRIRALNRLEYGIHKYEKQFYKALRQDLNKSPYEAYMTEIAMVLNEIRYVKKYLKSWMKPKSVKTPLAQFPAKSFIISEPYGVVLIMSPWNYPLLLTLEPLIGAIGAGNCCILKPSEYSQNTSKVIENMIEDIFPESFVTVVTGGQKESQELLNQKFDYIFFTGSVAVGKLVMEKASVNLTPVTLELGGKSPCIVDETANLKLAAKRIVFGKYLNAGQTCVAPDYILVNQKVEKELIVYLRHWIHKMYGANPLTNSDYPRIINSRHYRRIIRLMKSGFIVEGGYGDGLTRKIAPTILTRIEKDSAIMKEEIFGPVLPILSYNKIQEVKKYLRSQPKPLALYLFTKNKKMEKDIMEHIPFGGGCINDTIIHLASSELGFGGVGESGMGAYHGKSSFDTFSHKKSIVRKSQKFDVPVRYQPYGKIKEWTMRHLIKY